MRDIALYFPYKSVGLVTDSNPFVINSLGEEVFLVASIGSSFQVYRFDRLIVCMVSQDCGGRITALQVKGHETFVATGRKILVYDRLRIVRTYEEHEADIVDMCLVGDVLFSFDTENNMKVIDTKEREVIAELHAFDESGGITVAAHPSTYLNKYLIGYSSGALELWNVRKQKLIYKFQSHMEVIGGTSAPAVTCVEQSPALDVMAVGYADGHILLINLKLDKVLFSFKQDGGKVTSLTFRTDKAAQRFPYMASSSADGRVHVWNLGTKGEEDPESDSDDSDIGDDGGNRGAFIVNRKLQFTLEEAHRGAVSRVHFMHGEPIMVTAAADNCIKVWIFDAPDGSARLLKSRDGHSSHPSKIRYYGGVTNSSMQDNATAESCELISCGSDGTLRSFNTAIESQNREMSAKVILDKLGMRRRNERLPQCLDFDFCETRQKDWGNVVTVHKNHSNAYVWRYKNKTITEMILRQPNWHNHEKMYSPERKLYATAVALSPCGNFAYVGHKDGAIYVYNLQSGQPRGSLPKIAADPYAVVKKGTIASRAAVPGNVRNAQNVFVEPTWTPMNAAKGKNEEKGEEERDEDERESTAELRHTKEVRGIFVDLVQGVVVTIALDGRVIFWDYKSHTALDCLKLDSPQIKLQGFRDAGFVAVVSLDRVVRVLDLSTRRMCRRFDGHSREVSDVAFTPDGRRLLTSSLDCTVRVWDMTTARCLSWLSFGAPVLSITVSLSGEYLCATQSGKEGIFMYLDRSLYETVQFWNEPTEPTPVADSKVALTEGVEATAYSDGSYGPTQEGEDGGLEPVVVQPPQGQVASDQPREAEEQRGLGALTMSSLPRAYWTSLFNLELIKSRNKPKAPPAPKEAAPFFLPTVRKNGAVAASFPTPDEYAQLKQSLDKEKSEVTDTGSGKRAHAQTDVTREAGNKKRKMGTDSGEKRVEGEEKTDDEIMHELAAMGSAWDDDGEDKEAGWGSSKITDVEAKAGANSVSKPASRILSKATKGGKKDKDKGKGAGKPALSTLPRCKMVAFLAHETSEDVAEGALDDLVAGPVIAHSKLLGYLKTLPPPALDLELRALCTGVEDEEGISLLARLLKWILQRLRGGSDFEVLEAYLHRIIEIYADVVIASADLSSIARRVAEVHQASASKLQDLVQSNLCLLKMFAMLPPL